jgi:chitinase
MFWQLKSDRQGTIIKTVLNRALGSSFDNTTQANNTSNTASNTTSNTTNTTTNTTNTTNNTQVSNTTNTSSQYILSMFYCGFGGDFCGQSTFDDVNPKSSIVLLAFANTQLNGSIQVDNANFPITVVNGWKASGKTVLLSVGGQNGRWDVVFTNSANTNNFINSIYSALIQYNLDGIDLDI